MWIRGSPPKSEGTPYCEIYWRSRFDEKKSVVNVFFPPWFKWWLEKVRDFSIPPLLKPITHSSSYFKVELMFYNILLTLTNWKCNNYITKSAIARELELGVINNQKLRTHTHIRALTTPWSQQWVQSMY